MLELIEFLVIAIGGVATLASFAYTIRLIKTDSGVYAVNHQINSSFKKALTGTVSNFHEMGKRNGMVNASLAVDKKTGLLIELGTISDDSVSSMLNG